MPERDSDVSRLFLEDICIAIDRIITYTSRITRSDFGNDPKTQDAVIRNLEILGEAVKNLPETFKDTYPFVPWKRIVGMRDKLIHHYFGVSLDIVWTTATEDIPEIRPVLLKIQKMENEKR
jgi:uncharacterized protein with HEPN domain